MKYLSTICMISLLLCACKEEEIITQSTSNDPYELLWQATLSIDTSYTISMQPVVYNDRVFCSAAAAWGSSKYFLVNSDGIKFWVSDDDFEEDCSSPPIGGIPGWHQQGNLLAYLCSSDPRVFDLNTAQTLWHYEVPGADHGPVMSGFNETLFHYYVEGNNPFTSTTLVQANIHTGIWDTIFSLNMVDDYSVEILPPGACTVGGDTIIAFHTRKYNFDSFDGQSDVYAYNLTADTLLWTRMNIDPYGDGSVWPIEFYEDRLYYHTGFAVMCLNRQTGETLWEWESDNIDEDLNLTDLVFYEDKVIVKPYGENMYALNAETGTVMWKAGGFMGYPSRPQLFEGNIYVVNELDGKLSVIDAETGAEVWTLSSPNAQEPNTFSATFSEAVTIDPLTRRFYITDRYFLLCYQLK